MARRRSARQSDFLFGEIVELDKGKIVARSFSKTFKMLVMLALLAVAGLACLVGGTFAVFAGLGYFKNNNSPALVIALGIVIGLAGAAVLFFAGLGLIAYGAIMRHRERFIVGKVFLQRIIDEAKANLQIPWADIQRIQLETKTEESVKYDFIGIDLADAKSDDTILSTAGRKAFRRDFGFDVAIFDDYEIPLEDFHEELVARWEKASARASDSNTASRRRRAGEKKEDHQSGRAAGLIVGASIAGLVFLLVLGILLGVARQKNAPNPVHAPPVAKMEQKPVVIVPPPNVGPPPQDFGDPVLNKIWSDFGSANPFIVQTAIDQLTKIPPNAHRAVLARKLGELADSIDFFTRKAAVRALAEWGTPNEIPVLVKRLEDPDVFARQDVLKVIGKFHDDRAVGAVVRCFRDFGTRDQAAKTLVEMGPSAEQGVLPLLKEQDILLRQAAIKVLKEIGTERSVAELQAVVKSNEPLLQAPAREAVAAITSRAKR